jgi:hypothetical protein
MRAYADNELDQGEEMKFEDQTNRAPEHCADTEPFPPVPLVIQLLHLVFGTYMYR